MSTSKVIEFPECVNVQPPRYLLHRGQRKRKNTIFPHVASRPVQESLSLEVRSHKRFSLPTDSLSSYGPSAKIS